MDFIQADFLAAGRPHPQIPTAPHTPLAPEGHGPPDQDQGLVTTPVPSESSASQLPYLMGTWEGASGQPSMERRRMLDRGEAGTLNNHGGKGSLLLENLGYGGRRVFSYTPKLARIKLAF